jgi:threonine aldolase
VLGGGMRQVGMLAAACLYALDHHVARLAQDHANAKRLAEGLARIRGVKILLQATNMVHVQFPPAHCEPLQRWLCERQILAAIGPTSRFATHLDVSAADVDRVVSAVQEFFDALPRR